MKTNFHVVSAVEPTDDLNTPERTLLWAILERALRDLNPRVSNEPKIMRSAISWFKVKKSTYVCSFKEIINELQLTNKSISLIEAEVRAAEHYVRTKGRELYRQDQQQRQRQAHRVIGIELAERSRVSFRPEKPTVQWNSWNVGRTS